jgi:pilus assembly protein FimV
MSPIDMAPLSPLTDLHGEPDPVMGQTVSSSATVPGEFEDDSISHLFGATAMSPRPPRDTASAGLTANTFGDLASTGPADGAAPAPDSGFNFGGLDFDLGPSKLNLDLSTQFPAAEPTVVAPPAPSADPDFPPDDELERTQQSAWPTIMPMPNIDLNLPPPGSQTSEPAHDDDLLFKPTVMSAINAAHPFDEPRLTVNSEQATVPLIDFDLLPTEAGAQGRRTEAQPGSPVASQMETKLDLARGYIDLGVKDGARELLEEVLKDGTREQRQQAVELIKLIDA